MELKRFVDQAFEKYEESPELVDFKEELLTNLQDRLNKLERDGVEQAQALKEIEIEFADINKIADEMSLAKKKEVFESRYMSFRHFVTKPRAAIFTILGVLTIFGLVTLGLHFLSIIKIEPFIGILIVCLSVPLAGFVYMGLTQETATRNPVKSLRALIYAVSVFILLFGISLVTILVLNETKTLENVLMILIPFALPSIGMISFLIITEKDYRKAWVIQETEKHHEWAQKFETSGNAQTFGIMTGGVWILATGAFVLLLILKLWVYSWIPLIVATAITLFLLAYFMKKSV